LLSTLVEGVQHTGYTVRALISGCGEKGCASSPTFLLISVPLRCRHGILDKARLASKELMELCTQSSGEVVL
jgi:hypothetical protein